MSSKLSWCVVLCLVLSACNPPEPEQGANASSDPGLAQSEQLAQQAGAAKAVPVNAIKATSDQGFNQYYGFYVGGFEAEKIDHSKSPMYHNKINVSIDAIQDGKINGHSVVAGNSRPFKGSITRLDAVRFKVRAQEPGDDPYDGVFEFVLDGKQQKLIGKWVANDKKLAVSERSYELRKTVFKYNPALELEEFMSEVYNPNVDSGDHKAEAITPDAAKFNASTTLLTSKDVENMYKRDLEIMRNAIYARHGYSFQNREMRYFFDAVDWYIPVSLDVTKQLTELEQKNIALLKRYENHAASYYDRFGR